MFCQSETCIHSPPINSLNHSFLSFTEFEKHRVSSDIVPQVHLLISWSTPHSLLNFSSSKCYRLISGVTTTIIDTCQMFNCFFLLKGNKHTKIGGLCYILMYPILGTYTVIYSFRETAIFLQVSPAQESTTSLDGFLAQQEEKYKRWLEMATAFFDAYQCNSFSHKISIMHAIRSVLSRFENLNR